MAVWRSAAYVVRRLGREFLILGGVLLVIYIAVDQYMRRQYRAADAAWAKRYAEIYPERRDGVVFWSAYAPANQG